MSEQIVCMSELHGRTVIDEGDNYVVDLAEVTHFILAAGAKYPSAAMRFDHPNLAARQDTVFYTRAYWPDGRKKWFLHAGRDFFLVIPRERIELIFAKGYSYVPVRINGQKFHLSVSGGTISPKGWADVVRQKVHVGIGISVKRLNLLAEVAVPPREAQGKVELELAELDEQKRRSFIELVAAHDVQKVLGPGGKLMLAEGYSYDGQRGPFVVSSKPTGRKCYACQASANSHFGFRANYQQIDWTETAKANGIPLVEPLLENRLTRNHSFAATA